MFTSNLLFIAKKRNQMDNWFDTIGGNFNVSGNKVRDLLKNLGKEFRSTIQKTLISGEETEERTLKGSSEIYQLYENFSNLYYPKGSAVLPKEVLTESGEASTVLNTSQMTNIEEMDSTNDEIPIAGGSTNTQSNCK